MIIYNFFEKISSVYNNKIILALGTFDGVHAGHRHIIRRTVTIADKIGGVAAVFTFTNHPLSIIAPTVCPKQIITNNEKVKLLRNMGVDIIFNIPFTKEIANLPAHNFIELLRQNINPQISVVGENYSYGRGGRGTPYTLKESGVAVEVNEAVVIDGVIVSSTVIRNLIDNGNTEQALKLLGRPLTISGQVTKGQQRGKILGFPTANIAIPVDHIVPNDGVYSANCLVDGKVYKAVANVGSNPTFKGLDRRIEVHIINFFANIYDHEITIYFQQRLRDEIKFTDSEQLRLQIIKDIYRIKTDTVLCRWQPKWEI